jgi:hypothetical protein
LHAQGEQTHDLLIECSKGYQAFKDSDFVEYVKERENMYEKGGNIENNQLMDWLFIHTRLERKHALDVKGILRRRPL